MNDSYCTTDVASEPTASSSVNLLLDEIDESDIRILAPYDWDNDGETLVGIGPLPSRLGRKSAPRAAFDPPRKSAPKATLEPPLSVQPVSVQPVTVQLHPEQPGPWGSDDEGVPATVRGKKLGIWGVAVPALLVAAAAAVVFLRALGGIAGQHPERPIAATVAPSVRATAGLAVPTTGLDVHVYLDGQDHGRPPLVLRELTPGSHALTINGPGFAPFEQPVLLVSDHVSVVEPKLTFVHGAIRVIAGDDADGASVEVVGNNERRTIASLPARLEAAPGDYAIRAKKPGFLPFDTNVQIAATTPEAEVRVELQKIAPFGARGIKTSGDAAIETPGVTTTGSGTLSITSSPPANIVLDGRPLGKAPRSLETAAGSHTVLFVHPKYGRQTVTVNVAPDQTTSASADF